MVVEGLTNIWDALLIFEKSYDIFKMLEKSPKSRANMKIDLRVYEIWKKART